MPTIKQTKTPAILTEFDFGSSSLGKILLAMQGPSVVKISLGDSETELLANAQARFFSNPSKQNQSRHFRGTSAP